MSMDYGTAYIGIKTKDGELMTYCYGYDNEIVPDVKVNSDWKELFSDATTREEFLSGSFKDPWGDYSGLKEAVEGFDIDGEYIIDYNQFMRAAENIKAEDVDVVALGVVHGGRGFFSYDWRILDYSSGKINVKSWERDDDPYTGPGEECIAEAIDA